MSRPGLPTVAARLYGRRELYGLFLYAAAFSSRDCLPCLPEMDAIR